MMRADLLKSKVLVALMLFVVIFGSELACNRRSTSRASEPHPVTATFVISKLRYGYSKESEREIWNFEWDNNDRLAPIGFPQLFGSINRYRTLGWAREAVGGDRIFQTYDLVLDRMGKEPVDLSWKDGINRGYRENGWHAQKEWGEFSIRDKCTGVGNGDFKIRFDGSWKRLSMTFYKDPTGGNNPMFGLGRGEYSWDAFFGDVVVTMKGLEILRQRVDAATSLELNARCQYFPIHEIFVFLDGARDRPGTAWFLDLAMGEPRSPQVPDRIFPGRKNTRPIVQGIGVFDPLSEDKDNSPLVLKVGKQYLIKADAYDQDLEYGDSIIRYEWQVGGGKIVATKEPEYRFVLKAPGTLRFRARATDKAGEPGEWLESYLSQPEPDLYPEQRIKRNTAFQAFALNPNAVVSDWIKRAATLNELQFNNSKFEFLNRLNNGWVSFLNTVQPGDKVCYWEEEFIDKESLPVPASGYCILRQGKVIRTFLITPQLG